MILYSLATLKPGRSIFTTVAAIDDAWIDLAQALAIDTEPRFHIGAEVFDSGLIFKRASHCVRIILIS